MIARVIYEGQLSDNLEDCFAELIKKARIAETYFYLRLNGVTIFISDSDTVDSLLQKYEDGLKAQELLSKFKRENN